MIRKIFRKTIGIILASAMMLSVSGCSISPEQSTEASGTAEITEESETVNYADAENPEFEQYIQDTFVKKVTVDSSEYNQQIKDPGQFGIERPGKAYWFIEPEGKTIEEKLEADKKEVEEEYNKLMQFEGAELTKEEYFTFITEKSALEVKLKGCEYVKYQEPFYPNRGIQSNVGISLAEFIFREKADVDAYIELLKSFPEYVSFYVEFDNWRAGQGYAMQDSMADTVIDQCNTFLENKDNHYLIQEFDRKIDEADFLSASEKEEYKKQDKENIKYVFDGIEMIKKCVTANKGKASVKGGLANYSDGKAYFNEYIIPYFAGSTKTGDELIEEFETRISQIRNEVSMIAQNNPEAYQYFLQNAGTMFSDFDTNEVSDALDIIMEKNMENYPELPEIKYQASYLSPVLSDIMVGTLAYYMHPAYDEPDKNVIRVNRNHPEDKWLTLAHEGCPGHMFQFNYLMSTDQNMLRKSAYSLGYLEGWAVYSSYNTYENFDYPDIESDKIVGRLSYLNTEMNYLLQERMDIGINYEGWDVKALEKWMKTNGLNAAAANETYEALLAQDPGLLLSYSEGYYEMKEMRDYAEKKLGGKFNLVDYHKAVLSAGPCMFKDLKLWVDQYINEN